MVLNEDKDCPFMAYFDFISWIEFNAIDLFWNIDWLIVYA